LWPRLEKESDTDTFLNAPGGVYRSGGCRWGFGRLRPGVRMLRTGRQRRVLRRLLPSLKLLNPRFQLGNLRQQQADDGLGFRRLAGNDFFRDSKLHVPRVAEIALRVRITSSRKRLHGVNGYVTMRADALGYFLPPLRG
jgi:hypothetical protein